MLIATLTAEEMAAFHRAMNNRPLPERVREHQEHVTDAKWMFGCDNDDCRLMDDGVPTA